MSLRLSYCLIVLFIFTAETGAAQSCFTDHGIAAPVSENRSMDAVLSDEGHPLVLAIESSGGKSSLLVIDAETGETTQHFYPNEADARGGVFTRLWSSRGNYYLVLGGTFVEFDPVTREWTYEEELKPNSLAMSFAEAPDGTIYIATYPRAELYRFDPEARRVDYLTQLDPSEKYPYYLAVDDAGWVYSGLGTVRSTVVGYHPEKEEKKLFYKTILRSGEGTAAGAIPQVYRGVDGEVYGEAWPGGPWLRLREGEAERIDDVPDPIRHRSAKFTKPLTQLPNGGEIRDFDLASRTFELVRSDGSVRETSFDYESRGANITRLVEGPDGDLYGGTSHPMQFFHYDPAADRLENLGGIEKVGGGNFPAYAVAGGNIYGTAYVGGHLYEINPAAEWTGGEGEHPNPRLLESFSRHIGRPRVMQVRDDQLIIGGFPGYGDVGGGLAFYDLTANESTLLTNTDLVRGQSTIALRVLPNGDLVAGTSIAAPGGADPIAEEAVLYILDGSTQTVTFNLHPIEGAQSIPAVEIAPDGEVLGLTNDGRLFTFDPDTKEVGRKVDLSEHGQAVRTDQSLRMTEDGTLLVLLTEGLLQLNPETLEVIDIVEPPTRVSAGIGLVDNRLYFASNVNVWSYDMEGCTSGR